MQGDKYVIFGRLDRSSGSVICHVTLGKSLNGFKALVPPSVKCNPFAAFFIGFF